jgi:membrane protein
MLRSFRVPVGWAAIARRTATEVMADDCLGLAAQLAFYFFLALFPALLFIVAIISFIPVEGLLDTITGALSRIAPGEMLSLVQDQVLKIAHQQDGGLLTLGMLGTIWSTSSGVDAIISTLNQAYDIQESRPWWRVKLLAIGLTIALALFIVVSFALIMVGPTAAEAVAARFYLGPAFVWTWKILQWPVVFALVTLAMATIYYFAPDAEQEWVFITPGSILATALWVIVSLGFKLYILYFASYNATYGAIGGVIVVLLWFYVSALAVLVGAELNAEIEHASPYGKDPGEKVPGETAKIGVVAERAYEQKIAGGTFRPALAAANCDIDVELPPAAPAAPPPPRASDWILGGIVLAQASLVAYTRVKSRFKRIRG